MKVIGIVLTVLITLILAPIFRGYALSKLWLWFIVSAFGVVPLGIAQSIGLALVVSFITHQYDGYIDREKSATERLIENSVVLLLSPALALLVGWVVKAWM